MGTSNKDIMQVLGRIEGKLEGVQGHVEGLSAKATRIESKIDNHIGSDDAHGAGTERRVWGKVGALILGVGSLLGLLLTLYKAVAAR